MNNTKFSKWLTFCIVSTCILSVIGYALVTFLLITNTMYNKRETIAQVCLTESKIYPQEDRYEVCVLRNM